MIGFQSDEGVRRNQGRTGAKDGPVEIRRAMTNLAVHHDDLNFYDAGGIICEGENLETAVEELIQILEKIHQAGSFPILLGGGHEISYPHYKGSANSKLGAIGMINLDAHFDLREYPFGPHSGSWARQMLDDCQQESNPFHYLPIGINPAVNHRGMFELMEQSGQDLILLDELADGLTEQVLNRIDMFLAQVDQVCVTLDLDVISGASAPGVSAIAPFGISPELTWGIIDAVFNSGKVISFDIAELNPKYDDNRTAKLAAQVVWKVINKLTD